MDIDENRPPINWKSAKIGLCCLFENGPIEVDAHGMCADCAWLCGCYTCLECGEELKLGEGEVVDGRRVFCVSCATEMRTGSSWRQNETR